MKEFKINEFITLKLENNETIIYVKSKKFRQCLRLVLQIPKNDLEKFDQIDSIDEATEVYKHLYKNLIIPSTNTIEEELPFSILPEQEFQAHCSNLQAWVENEYDTRLLHSNLSFPLLKELTEIGDPLAKKVFKNEIIERFASGYKSVIIYLKNAGYLKFLKRDEIEIIVIDLFKKADLEVLESLVNRGFIFYINLNDVSLREIIRNKCLRYLKSQKVFTYETFRFIERVSYSGILSRQEYLDFILLKSEATIVEDLEINLGKKLVLYLEDGEYIYEKNNHFIIKDRCVDIISISKHGEKIFPEELTKLSSLTKLYLKGFYFPNLPKSIGNLKSLTSLYLWKTQLSSVPESIGCLKFLTELVLKNNKLSNLPESLGNLKSLKSLDLSNNRLNTLPDSIGDLESLRTLDLKWSQLRELPESIGNLKSLTTLDLRHNNLTTLPESLGNLKSLQRLCLSNNKLTKLPESINGLESLKELYIKHNKLVKLPELIGNLKSLKLLWLKNNKILRLPESICKIDTLRDLDVGRNGLIALPESIGDLHQLRILHLERNKLKTLPKSFGNFYRLTIYTDDNLLNKLDPGSKKLLSKVCLVNYVIKKKPNLIKSYF